MIDAYYRNLLKKISKGKGIKYVGFGKEKADHGEPWGDGY